MVRSKVHSLDPEVDTRGMDAGRLVVAEGLELPTDRVDGEDLWEESCCESRRDHVGVGGIHVEL